MSTLTLGSVTLALPLEVVPCKIIRDANERAVVQVNTETALMDEVADHAVLLRIFAASPDLLLAAEEAVRICREGEDPGDIIEDVVTVLSTAIARARGEKP